MILEVHVLHLLCVSSAKFISIVWPVTSYIGPSFQVNLINKHCAYLSKTGYWEATVKQYFTFLTFSEMVKKKKKYTISLNCSYPFPINIHNRLFRTLKQNCKLYLGEPFSGPRRAIASKALGATFQVPPSVAFLFPQKVTFLPVGPWTCQSLIWLQGCALACLFISFLGSQRWNEHWLGNLDSVTAPAISSPLFFPLLQKQKKTKQY